MSHVYILSLYSEHGLEEPKVGTADRARLPALLVEYFPDRVEELAKLAIVLREMPDPPPNDYGDRLSDGWGGVMLTVVEVEPEVWKLTGSNSLREDSGGKIIFTVEERSSLTLLCRWRDATDADIKALDATHSLPR